jgi:hypothetical protein
MLNQTLSGLNLRGDVRDIKVISSGGRTLLIVGETGMPVKSYVLNTTIQ